MVPSDMTVSVMTSQASNASAMSSQAAEINRVKLRLCYGGTFEQGADGIFRYVKGQQFNESVPADCKYADFMFKLSEKFDTAVSVKYLAPGDELAPDQLITVQDDDDFKELVDEYFEHLRRPGTPLKTFRIRVFAFPAAEDPVKPDEILDGQSVFSSAALVRLRSPAGMEGTSSLGSTLSSTGTPLHRWIEQPEDGMVSVALMPMHGSSLSAVQVTGTPYAAGLDPYTLDPYYYEHQEQAWLQAIRCSVANNGGVYVHASDHSSGQDEVLDAIDEEQAAAAAAAAAAAVMEGEGLDVEGLAAELAAQQGPLELGGQQVAGSWSQGEGNDPGVRERHLPNDPFDMAAGRISPYKGPRPASDDLAAALEAELAAVGAGQAPAAAAGGGVGGAAGSGLVSRLPSHISAFGEDSNGVLSEDLEGLGLAQDPAGGSGSDVGKLLDPDGAASEARGAAAGAAAVGGGTTPGRGAGFRTQDSRFSLAGLQGVGQDGGAGSAGTPGGRSPSPNSSLASLPESRSSLPLYRGDLTVVRKIGEGAFGEVALATTPSYGLVAVKWLKPDRQKHCTNFLHEARMLSRLNHPNILRYYGLVYEAEADTVPAGICTEYIQGGSLAAFLRSSRAPLPLRLRCELALGACIGLDYLHRTGVVHFDLKPDNLLLDASPAVLAAAAAGQVPPGDQALDPGLPLRSIWSQAVKVSDFGLSKFKFTQYVSTCRDLRGTLPYMAPELVADPEHVSEKADVWSLGVVMWEMTTREAPFHELSPQAIIMGLMTGNLHLSTPDWVEPEWRGLMEACWEPNSAARPTTSDLLKQLRAIHEHALAQEAGEVPQAAPAAAAAPNQSPAAVPAAGHGQQHLAGGHTPSSSPAVQRQQPLAIKAAESPVSPPAASSVPDASPPIVAVTPPAHLPMWLRGSQQQSQQQSQPQVLPPEPVQLPAGWLSGDEDEQEVQQQGQEQQVVPLVVPGRLPGLPRLLAPMATGTAVSSTASLLISSGASLAGSSGAGAGLLQQLPQQQGHVSAASLCAQQEQHHLGAASSPKCLQLI